MGEPRIVVRKSAFALTLVTDEGTVRFPVAIGRNPDGADKRDVGDCRTPEGEFTIESIEDSSEWDDEGARVYGPFFLRLCCPPWEGIGIHGTNDDGLVGRRTTRGCIRLKNGDLAVLVGRVAVGTRVEILP
ncbi:MAG: L,D-transpeptidase [Candidatus Eisenbacteria bacterium]